MSNSVKKIDKKELLKKAAIFSLMFLVFIIFMYIVFKPDEKEEENFVGLNTEVPLSSNAEIIEDKRKAYEFEALLEKNDRTKTLEEFNNLTGFVDIEEHDLTKNVDSPSKVQPEDNPIVKSAQNYQALNNSLKTISSTNSNDDEVRKLREEISELKTQIQESKEVNNVVDEHLDLVEKSLEMVSKYYPTANTHTQSNIQPVEIPVSEEKKSAFEVVKSNDNVVSTLTQQLTNEDVLKLISGERNFGFNTITDNINKTNYQVIKACIDKDQVLENGQYVTLRLLSDIKVGEVLINKNSLITGVCRVNGERLLINVNSLQAGGNIFHVNLSAYDMLGQEGLYIPNSLELNTAKEILANMGGSASTNIMVTSNAGQQVASDLAKGAVQGVSQYFQKKVRQVRVNVRANDKVLLVSSK